MYCFHVLLNFLSLVGNKDKPAKILQEKMLPVAGRKYTGPHETACSQEPSTSGLPTSQGPSTTTLPAGAAQASRLWELVIPGVCANVAPGILLSSKYCSFFFFFSEGKQMAKTGCVGRWLNWSHCIHVVGYYFTIKTSNVYFYSNS